MKNKIKIIFSLCLLIILSSMVLAAIIWKSPKATNRNLYSSTLSKVKVENKIKFYGYNSTMKDIANKEAKQEMMVDLGGDEKLQNDRFNSDIKSTEDIEKKIEQDISVKAMSDNLSSDKIKTDIESQRIQHQLTAELEEVNYVKSLKKISRSPYYKPFESYVIKFKQCVISFGILKESSLEFNISDDQLIKMANRWMKNIIELNKKENTKISRKRYSLYLKRISIGFDIDPYSFRLNEYQIEYIKGTIKKDLSRLIDR
ncbi:hypothetical protein DID75_01750 [Candidatus Marinamargulisbacteria bacterium SCGC AG-410-N11]|nr:hypothetical protein DID75_01750 [Candidatus Marinamargulisbacteria bacterium SCGC AG-410-N11]